MSRDNIFFKRISWHFLEVPKQILVVWKNFLLFNLNYFSIPLLLKTFFSPWRRYSEPYSKTFNIGRHLETFFANLIYCLLGALMRSFLIIAGLTLEVIIFLLGLAAFFGWLVLPFFLLWGFLIGLSMVFKGLT